MESSDHIVTKKTAVLALYKLIRKIQFMLQLVISTLRLQYRLMSRNIEELTFVLVMPLQTLVTIPFFIHSGRIDLAPLALTSSLLFTVGQMGFFVGGEIIAKDRRLHVLQLIVASPAPYSLILTARTIMVCIVGLLGFFESWAIAYFVFGVEIVIHHGYVFLFTLLLTAVVGGFTAVLVSAIFCLAKNVRTLQNAINGPLYLLGGVLVPTTYLPWWLQVFSPFIFFYWAANLVRDSFSPYPISDLIERFTIMGTLGVIALIIGCITVRKMLERLRVSGDISLS